MGLFSLSSKIITYSVQNFCKSSLRTQYSSAIGLDKLYPSSSLKITTPKTVPQLQDEKFNGFIPIDKLSITYSLSTGPGGQSVNKVNTKVDLRFQVASAEWLHEDVRKALLNKLETKVTKDGYLVIRSDKTRSQQLNLADAMDRLRTLIRSAIATPKQQSPETEEKIRRRLEKANRERLIEKRMKSATKSQRQSSAL